jgi:hypothetical protein
MSNEEVTQASLTPEQIAQARKHLDVYTFDGKTYMCTAYMTAQEQYTDEWHIWNDNRNVSDWQFIRHGLVPQEVLQFRNGEYFDER